MATTADRRPAIGYSQLIWLAIFVAVFIWSAIEPKDRFTWVLEVAPAVIGLALMLVAWFRFPPTSLLTALVLVHAVVLMVGGHYTYAEVPLFDTFRDWFGSTRNNYDKVGHFMQGFAPAVLAREVMIRNHVVNGKYWTHLMVVSICLAFSAFYELLEWLAAEFTGDSAEAFLGTQGYVWDTQTDMAFALLGALAALILLTKLHDRQLDALHN
ncbi:MAG: DUF2238 domain-containing protein [Acidiferrobacterales bacterium]|nr:DUF2238 domain-containing protein [Acidiferrobacterales bacterium]